jgi:glycerate kinase
MTKKLDNYLKHFADIVKRDLGRDIREIHGSGAAGGLGAGLMVFLNAKLKPGADVIAEKLKISEHIKDADLVVTGEGRVDSQTIYGKTPVAVAKIAKRFEIPVLVITGQIGHGVEKLYDLGIDAMLSITSGPISKEESILNAEKLIASASESAARIIKTGLGMRK